MTIKEKKIGILGGMGPEATVELMRRIIAATPAHDDVDHIQMIVDNNPKVPSRIKALIDKTGESPSAELVAMGRRLEIAGADGLAIACNTAHFYANDIKQSVKIPLINMIESTASTVVNRVKASSSIGLLASTAVVDLGLYSQALSRSNLKTIIPKEQSELLEIIKAVKRGDTSEQIRLNFYSIAENLLNSGASFLIIACTELSIISDKIMDRLPVIDALDVLTNEIINFCKPENATKSY